MNKAIGIRTIVLTLDIPNRVMPNSSGSGEAIISAPITGDSHLMKPKCRDFKKYFTVEGFSAFFKSSEKRSLIKRNSTRSPHIAPKLPHNTTFIVEVCSAI